MKIKTSMELLNIRGKSFEDNDGKPHPLLLGVTLSNMLSTLPSKNPALSYQLAKKFATQDEVDLSSENIVFIKSVISESGNPPITIGQILDMLENPLDYSPSGDVVGNEEEGGQ